jgi:hypothetical protein
MGKQLVNFITCGCESSAPIFVIFTKPGANPRRIGDRLVAHDRWFSPGTSASSTTKPGRHDIAEILLKVALKHPKINQSINEKSADLI